MRKVMLLPLACLMLQGGEPWADAQAMFRKELRPGHVGCLVYLERLGGSTLRLYLVAAGTRFTRVEGEPLGRSDLAFRLQVPRGSSDLRLVTEVPEGASLLRLKVVGEDISPDLMLHLPKPGEGEGTLVQVEAPPGGPGTSAR